jgi:hypothetical protein
MFTLIHRRASIAALLCVACFSQAPAQMKVERFTGPVTQAETDSFLAYVSTLAPDASNEGNRWSYGASGTAVRAMGMVYEIDHDPRLLDQMVRFCDAVLSERNDLAAAPIGQHMIWTGRIDPAWPNSLTKDPLSTGGEQGDPVGNLAYCARLILQTKPLWNKTVPIADQHHYGATYLGRAKTYVKQADAAIDGHILKSLLDLSHNGHQYFAANSPYKGDTAVPWNQQMMFNYGFQNMALAHQLLQDDPARTAKYHKIVQDSLDWFFSESEVTSTDKAGRPAYDWGYAMPSKGGEDATHAGMDVAGFCSAYALGSYGLTREKMTPFANTLLDIMTLAPGKYTGRVDGTSGSGHAATTAHLRSGYLLLAEFHPEAYPTMISSELTEGGSTDKLDLFSRFLWVKSRLSQTTLRKTP